MRETDPDDGVTVGTTGDPVVAVTLGVRVVDTREGDALAAHGQRGLTVVQVEPAAFHLGGPQVLPRQRGAAPKLPAGRREVPMRRLRYRCVEVVVPEHE